MASYRRTLTVEFEGEFGAALRRAGAKIEIGMGTITRTVTERTVTGARQTGAALGGVHAHVLPGLRARSNNIVLDVRSQPAILGAVFGGGKRPTTQQFPAWRGSGRDAGYMVFPELREQESQIDRLIIELLNKAL